MSRSERREVRQVELPVVIDVITCDGCGRKAERHPEKGDDPDNWIHELAVMLDDMECVSSRVRRDLCPDCLEPVWQKICEALGIEPDFTGDIGWEDGP